MAQDRDVIACGSLISHCLGGPRSKCSKAGAGEASVAPRTVGMGTWFPVPQAQNISLHLMGQHFGSDKMSLNATLHYTAGL